MHNAIEFSPLAKKSDHKTRLASVSIPAGEPTDLATEFERLDLNEYLTEGKGDVFLIRVVGDSMEGEITHGDLLVVNRNLSPQPGDRVLAQIGGGFTIKIYQPSRNCLRLVAANKKYQPRVVSRHDSFEIFGVVTHVLHKCR
ncbi:MAG: S24 family peptidase [Acidobacteriota bacterium]|nr:S24 family peptidase [Acidobacteriota bacterium]